MFKKILMRIIIVAGIIVSFLMLLKWNYAMYGIGKSILFGIYIYLVYYVLTETFGKIKSRSAVLLAMVVVFNPVVLMYLKKNTRQVVDIASGVVFVITYILLNNKRGVKKDGHL